jgi:sporulation protein YlmC with PRC-barrel domain
MSETTQFTIGADVSCTDGNCGEVNRVVVDPVAQALTHLVVEPKHRRGFGRLVPLELVDTSTSEVRLRCSMAEFEKLDPAEETEFLPGVGHGGYDPSQTLSLPYYVGGGVAMGMGGLLGGPLGMVGGIGLRRGLGAQTITHDSVPVGDVEVRRGDRVHATDGEIGRVQGLVIDPRTYHVTHVLLQEGHVWGRKEVAIPMSAVSKVDDALGIRLNIAKQEVEDLPSVELHHPSASS